MPEKHPDTERIGGPGASHENRDHPVKSKSPRGPHPTQKKAKTHVHSQVSGGGGERDRHHSHDPDGKAGD
jgi:hypothetical protein